MTFLEVFYKVRTFLGGISTGHEIFGDILRVNVKYYRAFYRVMKILEDLPGHEFWGAFQRVMKLLTGF